MKKKLTALFSALCMIISVPAVFAAEAEYIPLRKTFEGMGYTVSWSAQTPDLAFVNIGDYQIAFQNGSGEITVDEGVFDISKEAVHRGWCDLYTGGQRGAVR